jgi:hypothetical protein
LVDLKLVSHFPDFVFGWFNRFQLDKVSRKVVQLETSITNSADDNRIKFYLELSNPLLNKLWEVVLFREFVSDKGSIDELFFYLHYRNLLYQGAQLRH